ncbi:hypothetical protein OROGR_012766 [Orobanche gracilis]
MKNRDIQHLGQGKSGLIINRNSPSKGQRRMERTNAKGKLPAVGESSGVVKMERELERAKKEEERLPDDLTRKNIKRLPLRSAARLCTVSTAWLRMISQLNFAESHDAHHFLFTNTGVASSSSERYRWFQWATEDEVFSEDELMKGNDGDDRPCLAKFLNLPSCPISGETAFFFGFDPVGAHYKVLAVSDDVDAHVLTLVEGGELVWTPAPTNLPYSLEFVCHGPDKIGIYFELGLQHDYKLIKFEGKLALVIDPIRSGGEVHMAVLDDYQTQKWSKHSFILLGWGSLVLDNLDEQYHCMGTVSTGELIFAPESYVPPGGSVVLLSYNMEDKVLPGFKIQGVASEDDDNDELMTFVGYIVEPILLPGGNVELYRKNRDIPRLGQGKSGLIINRNSPSKG